MKKGGDGVVDMRAATGFHGKVFIDTEFAFFKALGAKVMGAAGFVNPRVLAHSARAYRKGFSGDTRGEGTQLGGLIVAGPVSTSAEDDVSIIYLYREQEWGDHAPIAEVLAACRQLTNGDGESAAASATAAPKL